MKRRAITSRLIQRRRCRAVVNRVVQTVVVLLQTQMQAGRIIFISLFSKIAAVGLSNGC